MPAWVIQPLQEAHFERLHQVFDAVCRERRFMAFTQAAPMEQTFAFYRSILVGGHAHFVAVQQGQVLGWCDVLPAHGQMRAHVGTLGMGVVQSARGLGVGRELITAAIAGAKAQGLSRIELTVHSENTVGQSLYRSVGFVHEGTQHQAWCLDGQYFDVHHMALLS